VQIRVEGTGFGVLTHTDGTYRLTGLKPGPVTVRALRLGFQANAQTATVPETGAIAVDFVLTATATTLDQVVVQATGESERTRETGNSVQVITADSLPKAAVANFSDMLSSRAPGVVVTQQSGTTGGTSRIRIRGNNSISLSNEPLLVIDGVRSDNDQSATQLDVGGQAPSRLDDLDPSEIEDITVLRGPAASALYGTAGANGVIQVTTKHGQAGKSVWRAFEEGGTVRNYVNYPANYAQLGVFDPTLPDTGANSTTFCTLLLQSFGGCTAVGPIISFNPLQALSPNIPGWRNNFGLSVSGGTDALNYFVSGDHRDEHGVYANNYANRTNARANLHASLSPTVDVSANIGYLQSGIGLPQNDNASYGVLSGGLLGSAFNGPDHGYLAGLTPTVWPTCSRPRPSTGIRQASPARGDRCSGCHSSA
jgi:TonB-dependent SusC/RagA subfamily outer membrane receptor